MVKKFTIRFYHNEDIMREIKRIAKFDNISMNMLILSILKNYTEVRKMDNKILKKIDKEFRTDKTTMKSMYLFMLEELLIVICVFIFNFEESIIISLVITLGIIGLSGIFIANRIDNLKNRDTIRWLEKKRVRYKPISNFDELNIKYLKPIKITNGIIYEIVDHKSACLSDRFYDIVNNKIEEFRFNRTYNSKYFCIIDENSVKT